MKQAIDFRAESDAIYHLLDSLDEDDFELQTQFKGWTVNNVIGHLHHWNWAADFSLRDGDAFKPWVTDFLSKIPDKGILELENHWLDGLRGRPLLETWKNYYLEVSARFESANPSQRVQWAGPDMSARSSITARLMETWSHSQAIYDLLGVVRVDEDRIQNIAQLGINTFEWTFRNRGETLPGDIPRVRLKAPSGSTWEWNEDNSSDLIEGSATQFCQVVTQTRNVADTMLQVSGSVASRWMSVAQCFAGPAVSVPLPGLRYQNTDR